MLTKGIVALGRRLGIPFTIPVTLLPFLPVACSFLSVACSFLPVACLFFTVACLFLPLACSFLPEACSFLPYLPVESWFPGYVYTRQACFMISNSSNEWFFFYIDQDIFARDTNKWEA